MFNSWKKSDSAEKYQQNQTSWAILYFVNSDYKVAKIIKCPRAKIFNKNENTCNLRIFYKRCFDEQKNLPWITPNMRVRDL